MCPIFALGPPLRSDAVPARSAHSPGPEVQPSAVATRRCCDRRPLPTQGRTAPPARCGPPPLPPEPRAGHLRQPQGLTLTLVTPRACRLGGHRAEKTCRHASGACPGTIGTHGRDRTCLDTSHADC